MRVAVLRFAAAPLVAGLLTAVTYAASSTGHLTSDFDQALADFDRAQELHARQPDRARQLYRSAAQRFESIVSTGMVNGRLEYNLGNCYLQAGDVGKAILHYRRAARLIPQDPLLADNLAEARSRRLTAIQATRGRNVLRSIFFWHYDTSLAVRSKAAVGLYVAVFILLMLRSLLPRRGVTVAAIIGGVLTMALAGSVAATSWTDRHAPEGVVTVLDVIVYKGPGTSYQRQFEQPLQPGVEFTLREARRDWWSIQLPDDNTGWIEATNAELVASTSTSPLLGSTRSP